MICGYPHLWKPPNWGLMVDYVDCWTLPVYGYWDLKIVTFNSGPHQPKIGEQPYRQDLELTSSDAAQGSDVLSIV